MLSNFDPVVLSVLVFLVFISPGLLFLFYGLSQRKKIIQSQAWSNTTGIISSRKIDTDYYNHWFYPSVTYSYEVNGRSFVHSRIRFGSPIRFRRKQDAEDYLANFPIGKKVLVYYNPERPQDSVLSKTQSSNNAMIFISLLMLLSGGTLAFYLIFNNIMPLDLPLLK
jgi:hypothetical protein